MKKMTRDEALALKKQDRRAKAQFKRARQIRQYGDSQWKIDWNKFIEQLAVHGLTIKDVAGDGNCLFRAIADQYEGDPTKHATYRARICDFMELHVDDFAPFLEEDQKFDQYVADMRKLASWGDHLELQAASLLLNVNICVHQLSQPRWEIINFETTGRFAAQMLHLSYHDGSHYASIRNANEPIEYFGPPTHINLPSSVPTIVPSSSSNNEESSEWKEDLILRSTCATNSYFIKAVLSDVDGNLDAAIEFIYTMSTNGEIDELVQKEFALERGFFPEGGFEEFPIEYLTQTPPAVSSFEDIPPELLVQIALSDSNATVPFSLPDVRPDSSGNNPKSKDVSSNRKNPNSRRQNGIDKNHNREEHMTRAQRKAAKKLEKQSSHQFPSSSNNSNTNNKKGDDDKPVDLGALRI